MQYSLEAGGKRIRPLLLFATLDAFGLNPKKGLLAAAAIEMIHTYSLIHDDLPGWIMMIYEEENQPIIKYLVKL